MSVTSANKQSAKVFFIFSPQFQVKFSQFLSVFRALAHHLSTAPTGASAILDSRTLQNPKLDDAALSLNSAGKIISKE
jgi:hypothetical protein